LSGSEVGGYPSMDFYVFIVEKMVEEASSFADGLVSFVEDTKVEGNRCSS
jgi:hypothetical protein